MCNGIIVLTAMPPTYGHAYLISFAHQYMSQIAKSGKLHVIVCSRPGEPIPGEARAQAIRDHFKDYQNIWVHHRNSFDPQFPDDHPEFWSYWRQIVLSKINAIRPDDILFASDQYGIEFAKQIGCRFQPCDTNRKIVQIAATNVREDPIRHFADMLPTFAEPIRKTVTFFGAESTGKTTLSQTMAMKMNGHWCHEWARSYLEMIGPEITDERMSDIVSGQYAAQSAVSQMAGKPFIIQDTDLLSTLGYYRIYGGEQDDRLLDLIERSKSDLYIVMNSRIPFTPDRLRYGGNVRESLDEFWINLLDEFGCRYHYIQETEKFAQFSEARSQLMALFHQDADWNWFKREAA